jgi:hypothetical protein
MVFRRHGRHFCACLPRDGETCPQAGKVTPKSREQFVLVGKHGAFPVVLCAYTPKPGQPEDEDDCELPD